MSKEGKKLFKLLIRGGLTIAGVTVYADSHAKVTKVRGKELAGLIHQDYQEEFTKAVSGMKDGDSFSCDLIFGKVSGRFCYVYVAAEKESGVVTLIFSKPDLRGPLPNTEYEGLGIMMNRLAGVYYRSDRFGNLIYFSERIRELVGYNSEELIGSNLRRDYFLNPDKYDSIRNVIFEEGSVADVEAALKHKDGSIIWIKASLTGLYDKGGTYIGSAGFVSDITKQKNSVEEVAHLQRLLDLKQKELDAMNVSMKYRVQSQVKKGRREEESILYHARLAEMGEMVGSIAHQWRQPLSALMFIIEDIRDAYHFGELDVQYLDDAIDECMSYVRFMSDTMDDFRNFFRPEPEKEQFNLLDKLVEVVKMQYGRFEVGAVNVFITCDLTEIGGECKDILFIEYGRGVRVFSKDLQLDSGIIVYGYPNLFKQVIINLVNNSIDSILEKRNDGDLGATDPGLIKLSLKAKGRRIFLSVEDNGTGIRGSNFESIFEPEFTTKPKNKGTGIGLHMARSIVEKSLGGKIRAENGENGALFTIELPRVAVAVQEK